MAEAEQPDLTALTVQLLSAYVANNTLQSSELPALIESTRKALAGETLQPEAPAPEHVPAVSVRKSLASRDHIISMIDGKPYKGLKRHLAAHGLTPGEYRQRYGLAADYPMVAPGYSEQRREVARRLGLGRKKGDTAKVRGEQANAAEPGASVDNEQGSPEPREGSAPAGRQAKAATLEKPGRGRKAAAARSPAKGARQANGAAARPRGKGKLKPVYGGAELATQAPDTES